MTEANSNRLSNLEINQEQLYREEIYTDMKVATIHRLVPVREDGSEDTDRSCKYTAETQLVTPMGAIPVQTEIEAQSLKEAVELFPEAMQEAVNKMVDEAQKRQIADAGKMISPNDAKGQGGLIIPR